MLWHDDPCLGPATSFVVENARAERFVMRAPWHKPPSPEQVARRVISGMGRYRLLNNQFAVPVFFMHPDVDEELDEFLMRPGLPDIFSREARARLPILLDE